MSFILSSNKIRGVRYTDNPNPITGENIVTKLPELYDSTTDTGYYGIKTSAQIMSGTQLATAMGITEGTSQNNTDGWLHFYVGKNATCNKTGKAYEIYVAKKAIRHSTSWDYINSKNGVVGKDVVANNGITYKCRLLTGANANPSTTTDGMGSEWNNLIYRVHSEVVNTGTNKQIGANWATMDNNELNISGIYTWCQEVYGPSPTSRVIRGVHGVSYFHYNHPTNPSTYYGWRPVLVRFL